MTLRSRIFLFVSIALLCSACSEEKKREAARLEAQLRGDTLGSSTNEVAAAEVSADTAAIDSMNRVATEAFDSSYQAMDSSAMSTQVSTTSPDTTMKPASIQTNEQATVPKDTVIPDVNAIPAENGAAAPRTMPRYIADAYTVQIASSTDRAFSQQIVDTFLTRGYDAYLSTVTRDNATYYRVRVGHFARPTEANQVAVEINQKYSLQSWVDKITK